MCIKAGSWEWAQEVAYNRSYDGMSLQKCVAFGPTFVSKYLKEFASQPSLSQVLLIMRHNLLKPQKHLHCALWSLASYWSKSHQVAAFLCCGGMRVFVLSYLPICFLYAVYDTSNLSSGCHWTVFRLRVL